MPGRNKTGTKLFLDAALFAAVLLALSPHLTGIPVHEWLSLAFAAALLVHLLLNWEWIVAVAPKFFAKLLHESRLNFLVDLVFFLDMLVIMVSGIAISRSVLPALGLSLPFSPLWRQAHRISADLGLIVLGIHCGLHVPWIVRSFKRCVVERISSRWGDRKALKTEGEKA